MEKVAPSVLDVGSLRPKDKTVYIKAGFRIGKVIKEVNPGNVSTSRTN